MTEPRKKYENIINFVLLGTIIFGVIFSIIGIVFMNNCITHGEYDEIVEDYTDCKPSKIDEKTCKEYLNTTLTECSCYILIKITDLIKAPVTAYYELESYDQITNKYSQSRDDHQLAGHLSLEPSESCGSHTYACTPMGRIPIAPCGRLADAMFNDTYSLYTEEDYVYYNRTGLVSEEDKKKFRNPEGNLTEAFKEFSKPMNWRNNVWELDTIDPANNGFQNEAFIVWMNTDLKRKPAWKVWHKDKYEDGLPVGNYTLNVDYGYPPSRYDGKRKFIITSIRQFVNSTKYGFGVALLVIGLVCIALAGLLLYRRRSTIKWRR